MGLAVDQLGNVYVGDVGNDRVQIFDPTGKYVGMWGSTGDGDGQFVFPSGISSDLANNIYVTDFNHRVQVFSRVK